MCGKYIWSTTLTTKPDNPFLTRYILSRFTSELGLGVAMRRSLECDMWATTTAEVTYFPGVQDPTGWDPHSRAASTQSDNLAVLYVADRHTNLHATGRLAQPHRDWPLSNREFEAELACNVNSGLHSSLVKASACRYTNTTPSFFTTNTAYARWDHIMPESSDFSLSLLYPKPAIHTL